MDKMRECPFCGGDARIISDGGSGLGCCVYCNECHVCTDDMKNDEQAIRIWNTRSYDAEIAELKAKLQIAREALQENIKISDHGIPYYGYGDNEAGCLLADYLTNISKISYEALAQIEDK